MRVTMTRSSRTHYRVSRRADIQCIYPAHTRRRVRRRAAGIVWQICELAQRRMYFAELLKNGLKATKFWIHVRQRFHDTRRFGHPSIQADGVSESRTGTRQGSKSSPTVAEDWDHCAICISNSERRHRRITFSQEMDTNRGFWIRYSWSTWKKQTKHSGILKRSWYVGLVWVSGVTATTNDTADIDLYRFDIINGYDTSIYTFVVKLLRLICL